MKKLILLLLFFPLNLSAQYFEDFSKKDWILQGALTGLVIIDWMQTSKFSRKKERICIKQNDKERCRVVTHRESNTILGEYPSQERINLVIGSALIINWVIVNYLKDEYRTAYQLTIIFFEIDAVNKNRQAGFKIWYNF